MPYYFYMCDMIPFAEHWRVSLAEAQRLQHPMMGYLPGFATPRIVCDVPFVGKRWVHQVPATTPSAASRTGRRTTAPRSRPTTEALSRTYVYYDPIYTLPEAGQAWWREHGVDNLAEAELRAAASRAAAEQQKLLTP